jgi:GTPase SAR1 family protein
MAETSAPPQLDLQERLEVEEPLLKILVIGDCGVGKTTIIRRYMHNEFFENYKMTMNVDFSLKVASPFFNHQIV